jgi:hypothetical protein
MCLPVNTDDIQELTTEQAKALLLREQGRQLTLSNLRVLSDEVSAILAQHDEDLFLNGLNDITPAIAEALAQHNGALRLDALRELGPEVARALGRHRGDLSLNGLRDFSDDAALALAGYEGDAAAWRAAKAAAEEERNQWDYGPGGLDADDDHDDQPRHDEQLEGEGALGAIEGEVHAPPPHPHIGSLYLNQVRSLTLLAASQLTPCCECLSLNGIENIDSELAAVLACAPNLALDGLSSLEPGVANNLREVEGKLSLLGLVSLDPEDVILFAEDKRVELRGRLNDAVSFAYDFIEAYECGDFFREERLGGELMSRAVEFGLNRALWWRIGKPYVWRWWSRLGQDDEGAADQETDRQDES